jgi:nascent polypeptide-associated complex subunit alpha
MLKKGQNTYQIVGDPNIRARSYDAEKEVADTDKGEVEAEEEVTLSIPKEDIELVCQQTGASEEEALAALEACGGNPAEAILKLMDN